MLCNRALVFPALVREPEDAKFRNGLVLPSYRLNWQEVDLAKLQAHRNCVHDGAYEGAGPDNVFYPLTTPEWQERINNLTFAVSDEYASEITRLMFLAQAEWVRHLPFHKVVKFDCLKTARAAAEAAFGLLLDCHREISSDRVNFLVFPQSNDEVENFRNYTGDSCWVRGDHVVLRAALLIRFWDQQMSTLFIKECSGVDRPFTSDSGILKVMIDLRKAFEQQYQLRVTKPTALKEDLLV